MQNYEQVREKMTPTQAAGKYKISLEIEKRNRME